MTQYTLEEISRSRAEAGSGIAFEDYGANPALCRHGVWIGLANYYSETVTISFEHDPDRLNVFWKLQNSEVLYPGPGAPTSGPVPAAPGVRYIWPAEGRQHKISFVSAPGTKQTRVYAQVLYVREDGDEIEYGPSITVRISGEADFWPPDKLEEEQRCQQHWHDLRTRYVRWREPRPGEPIMKLHEVRGLAAVRLAAIADAVESLDEASDRELAQALRAELTAKLSEVEIPLPKSD
ncbi:MAG TPA: hypothetical protein VF054_16955 [Micromonosporaceae bacterium]